MVKLQELLSKCKCGVHLTVNQHRNYYETAKQAIEEKETFDHDLDVDAETRAKMIELNTIIELQFFPHTPVGSYCILHYDLDAALDIALECLAV